MRLNTRMGRAGLEHTANPAGNSQVSNSGGSKSGNNGADFGPPSPQTPPTDADLSAVVAAWPDLPTALRAGIAAMVKAAATPKAGGLL